VDAGLRLARLAARTLAPGVAQVVALDDRLPEALFADSPELAARLRSVVLGGLGVYESPGFHPSAGPSVVAMSVRICT
jgi:hypothetical protein